MRWIKVSSLLIKKKKLSLLEMENMFVGGRSTIEDSEFNTRCSLPLRDTLCGSLTKRNDDSSQLLFGKFAKELTSNLKFSRENLHFSSPEAIECALQTFQINVSEVRD